MECAHEGFYSGQGRYDRQNSMLRYVIVCDDCGGELMQIARQEYAPAFDPHGNDPYVNP